ncbi:formylglycine-generating enzyme family protein [Streptomyces sp. NPDC101225]|uniref:formylglycine-generating enzyme family protein n=1 Tax=Streptomyces sp. NPDC101225 TaxID=3366135 RepID=UPI0037F36619
MTDGPPSGSCCAPRTVGRTIPSGSRGATGSRGGVHRLEQAAVPGGLFTMGDGQGDGLAADGELPLHTVALSAFAIDATTVTVADFAAFAEATGYRTDAERCGFSAVFHLAVRAPDRDVLGLSPALPWWLGVRGADWRRPGGRLSEAEPDHPVVHVSWHDATAYCAWVGRSLPTEAQWEYAARGGLEGTRYPWGDDLSPGGTWRCNIWQGRFPHHNTLEDGFLTTAPVRSFQPNGYGLWQAVGNVWEWCADWYSPRYYAVSPSWEPRGPESGSGRVMRGGSYLCHDSYCNRYRVAARSSNTPDSSTGNCGFRTVSAATGP